MHDSSAQGSAFGAAGPALGYLAQVDYALLAALERMDHEDDFSVSVETLDDIVFHDSDSDEATDKWQSKHTIDQTRSLSDASTDLWKTLANWVAEPGDPRTRLVLLAVASAGQTAALLRAGNDRDVVRAQERLERTAQTSESQTNAPYYSAFLGLGSEQRRALLERAEIFDGVLSTAEVQQSLERAVRKSVKLERRAALVNRLRGWWHKRAIAHLDAIARGQHDRSLSCLRLPTLCAMRTCRSTSSTSLFAQRSRWQRDRLVEAGELSRYDRELKEAWEGFFMPVGDNDDAEIEEDALRRRAHERFAELDRSNLAPIRRDVRKAWVARGSLHVIADRLEIGWHPQWLAHLRDRLGEVRDDPEAGAAA